MKTIGLIGGMSWESSAIYYRLLNEGIKERVGGLHSAKMLLWSVDFATIAALQAAGDWPELTRMMTHAAKALETAGAEAIVIGANTMHKMADEVAASIKVPFLHIADATSDAIKATASRRPALLATRYTMEHDFYKDRLKLHGLDPMVPDEEGRALIHRIIYEELCRGVINPASKRAYLEQLTQLRRQGADSVIFGCTEIGMLLSQDDIDIPVFDTMSIHVKSILDFALS